MSENKSKPRILLIGAGRFGMNHLRVWRELEKDKKVVLAGVVVKSSESKINIERQFGVKTYTKLSPKLLKDVDAVDIVTPAETHLSLIKRIIPHKPIFVEKPIVETEAEAKELVRVQAKYKQRIMVGHIYRYDPLLEKLKSIIRKYSKAPWKISGQLTKPLKDDTFADPSLDFIHHVDTLDYLLGEEPEVVSKRAQERVHELSLRYPGDIDAILTLGWIGAERVNYLNFVSNGTNIRADFLTNSISITEKARTKTLHVPKTTEPLKKELSLFLEMVKRKKNVQYPTVDDGLRIARASGWKYESAKGSTKSKRVAVIGAGLFGATAALELAKKHDVTIFERNNDIMTEASFVNQYRHHWGYHYPRSSETVKDIRRAMPDFEKMYDRAIIRDFPTYYSIAKEGSKVSANQYKKFCDDHNLPYELASPGKEFINEKDVSLDMKTLEPIYNYSKLKEMTWSMLKKNKHITLKFNSPVIGGYLTPSGRKVLMYQENGVMRHAEFDYVVNVTYANYNLFASWFKFARKRIRVDLVETLIMRIPIPRMSFAIMDGPFTNVVPTEHENIFTLVHIKESILQRFVPADGLIPPGLTYASNAKKIISESMRWLPFLKKAEYLESRYVFRSVNADREYDDARPSDVTYHGFGCWSVLGGKIINCITTAKQIATDVGKDSAR